MAADDLLSHGSAAARKSRSVRVSGKISAKKTANKPSTSDATETTEVCCLVDAVDGFTSGSQPATVQHHNILTQQIVF